MKKTVLELNEQVITKIPFKNGPESPKTLMSQNTFKKIEKKNTMKTYNDFVRMVINEENKERNHEEPQNTGSPKTMSHDTFKKFEKKNTMKTYNDFVRIVINEENKERNHEEPQNMGLNITPIKEKIPLKEKENNFKKNTTKIISIEKKTEENSVYSKKIFTPRSIRTSNEQDKQKNIKANFVTYVKKEGFNLTPNITPIKEALPDKKILVRSFSKGVLIPSQNQTNNSSLQKKVERINGQLNSIAKKKSLDSASVFNPIQNIIPPKPKKVIEKEKQENEIAVETQNNKNWNLTDDEKILYGDRIIENYEKLDLLGKGGFALVWLSADKLYNDRHVALKQIAKINSENCKKELYFGQMFFDEKGKPREEFSHYAGINYITQFLHHKITSKDLWMVFELGGHTLSKLLYEMKGEFFKGERVYQIKYSKLYEKLHKDTSLLQKFIRSVSEALILFSDYKIVHSDLKPDNILLELNKTSDDFERIKLIDFGSAYSFEEAGNISMATPEYMPPEVLELIMNSNKYTGPHKSQIEALSEVCQPWSVDVWSLASIILEILIGIPHWISYKCKVLGKKGKEVLKTGLFAVKGRCYDKIIAKQKSLIENLEEKLEEFLDIKDEMNQKLCDLLLKMFEWNPKKRISPEEIVKHPFLNNK